MPQKFKIEKKTLINRMYYAHSFIVPAAHIYKHVRINTKNIVFSLRKQQKYYCVSFFELTVRIKMLNIDHRKIISGQQFAFINRRRSFFCFLAIYYVACKAQKKLLILSKICTYKSVNLSMIFLIFMTASLTIL